MQLVGGVLLILFLQKDCIGVEGFSDLEYNGDPFEELVNYYNKGGNTLSASTCIQVVHGSKDEMYSPPPEEHLYSTTGFRAHGEPCDFLLERKFHAEMYNVSRWTAKDFPDLEQSQLEISPALRSREWTKVWNKWAKNETLSKTICNPRWHLECRQHQIKNVEVGDTCLCMETGLHGLGMIMHARVVTLCSPPPPLLGSLHTGIALEQEWVDLADCDGKGVCQEESHKLSYRCVSKDSLQDEHGMTVVLNSCELILPPFGTCVMDCNHDSECTVLKGDYYIGKENEKLKDRRVCCEKGKVCKVAHFHSGSTRRATQNLAALAVNVIWATALVH